MSNLSALKKDVFAEMHAWERKTQTVTTLDGTNVSVTLMVANDPQPIQVRIICTLLKIISFHTTRGGWLILH